MQESTAKFPLNILFVFIDGVGLGEENPDNNPFCQLPLPSFKALSKNQTWTTHASSVHDPTHTFRAIDARLAVEGLPQSGTGQATLFTGLNCAKLAGKHFGPYPHSTSKPVIATDNIFTKVNNLISGPAAPSAFANAYPQVFFKQAEARNRWTVTTLSCIESGILIRKEQELRNGKALTADITGKAWHERLNIDIDPVEEHKAAGRLVDLSTQHSFTLFEYYLTDKAGHSRDINQASKILYSLDRFFHGILEQIDFSQSLLLITSDHGNLEDLSTKSHTINKVPLIAIGKGASYFQNTHSILDVTPTILETLRAFTRTS